MSLSSHHLRNEMKTNIDQLVASTLQEKITLPELLPEIQNTALRLEQSIQEKICLLASDFHALNLSGDYLRSVRESFADIEYLMRHTQTFIDLVKCKDKNILSKHIKYYHRNTLVPLLNMMAKLENDYISITHQTISHEKASLNQLEILINQFKAEENFLKPSVFVYHKKRKLTILQEKINYLELQRKILQLILRHDQLNLYYLTQDHPKDMQELKQKADAQRTEGNKLKAMSQNEYNDDAFNKKEKITRIETWIKQYDAVLTALDNAARTYQDIRMRKSRKNGMT